MKFAAKDYYRVQFVFAVPFIQLTHAQKVILADTYSKMTGEAPADVYCDNCMKELYSRIKKEVQNFINAK